MKTQKWAFSSTRTGSIETVIVTGTKEEIKKQLAEDVKDYVLNLITEDGSLTDKGYSYKDLEDPEKLEKIMDEYGYSVYFDANDGILGVRHDVPDFNPESLEEAPDGSFHASVTDFYEGYDCDWTAAPVKSKAKAA